MKGDPEKIKAFARRPHNQARQITTNLLHGLFRDVRGVYNDPDPSSAVAPPVPPYSGNWFNLWDATYLDLIETMGKNLPTEHTVGDG